MSEYTSIFGVTRVTGEGEGRDLRNATSDFGMSGANHDVVAIVNEAEVGFNKDADNDGVMDSFGRGVSYVPAGAVVVDASVVKESGEGSMTIKLGDKEASAVTESKYLNTLLGKVETDAHVTVTADNYEGLKARIVISYVL